MRWILFSVIAILFISCGEKSSIDTFSKYEFYKFDSSKEDNLGRLVFKEDILYRLVLDTTELQQLNPYPMYASDTALKMYYPYGKKERAQFHKYSIVNHKKKTFLFVSWGNSKRIDEIAIFIMKPAKDSPADVNNLPFQLDSLKGYLDDIGCTSR